MIRKLLLLATLLLAIPPAAAFASNSTNDVATNASKQCTTLRVKIGATSFAQTFASFGACVSSVAPLERQNSSTAAMSCRSEQTDVSFAATHRGQTFARFYGTGQKAKNAFGNCVTLKAKSSSAAEQRSSENPAQTCVSRRSSMGTSAFATTYGTNGSADSAFGKCVSTTARAQIAAEVTAASSCRTEQADANFASSHSGKAFAQFYGTGDDSNAFGKCVAQKAHLSVAITATAQQQPEPVTPVNGCGPKTGGPPQPMAASCVVANTN